MLKGNSMVSRLFVAASNVSRTGKTYLDHGGATLYAKSLVDSFSQSLISNLYGNPHSASKPAMLSGDLIDEIRDKTLRFFGADPEHFDLVFVANATAAIKLVMESFRDLGATGGSTAGFRYLYHKDAHTSLVGVRETTDEHYCFRSDDEVEQWLDGSAKVAGDPNPDQPCLFSYPGQSNMTGRRLPQSWPSRLRSSRLAQHLNAYTLFDAAALATTSDLSSLFASNDCAPDFTCLSFYKIFGFPDLGGLIVRKDSGHVLQWRKFFGGGTILMATVIDQSWHYRKETSLHEALEDGTLPFHNIVALGCAIDVHRRLFGNMERISRHTHFLGRRLYKGLKELRHENGQSLVKIYNEEGNEYLDKKTQGSTVAFNLRCGDGSYVSYVDVEEDADEHDIYLRSGGLCNAGGIATYLNLKPWEFKRSWSAGHRCGGKKGLEVIGGKPTGVVRASLGAMSTIADVDALLHFLADTYCEKSLTIPRRISSTAHFRQPLRIMDGCRLNAVATSCARQAAPHSSISGTETPSPPSASPPPRHHAVSPVPRPAIPGRHSSMALSPPSDRAKSPPPKPQFTPPLTPPFEREGPIEKIDIDADLDAEGPPPKVPPKALPCFEKGPAALSEDLDAVRTARAEEEGRVWYRRLKMRRSGAGRVGAGQVMIPEGTRSAESL